MEPEEKHLLEEIHALAKDNHRLLRSVRRHQIVELFGKWVLYLILILGGSYYFFQYMQPLIEAGIQPSSPFQNLIDSYRTGQ